MKQGRNLVDLAQEITRRAESKRDYIAQTKVLTMEAQRHEDLNRLFLNVGDQQLGLNEIAHDQIGQFLQIPAQYYDRMRQEKPELLAANVNAWFASREGKRMVRTIDNRARAFLSDAYRPVENEDIAETVLPVLMDDKQFDIVSCEVTERRLYIKAVHKKVNRKLAETGNFMGDGKHKIVRVAAPAVCISNSEVGMGAVSIQVGLFDSFCSNLSYFAQRSMKKYHVGQRHDLVGDDVVGLLSAQTQNLSNAALMSQVRDVLSNAFNEERFNELCDMVDGSTQDRIEKQTDVVKLVSLTGKRIGLTEGEGKSVLQQLIAGGDLTRFGLYNAVTRAASDVESYDRATELERAGAAIVELPKNDWQVLLNQSAN